MCLCTSISIYLYIYISIYLSIYNIYIHIYVYVYITVASWACDCLHVDAFCIVPCSLCLTAQRKISAYLYAHKSDYDFLHKTWMTYMKRTDAPPLKVVVEDASHLTDHMATSLFFWLPRIEPGGIFGISTQKIDL